MEFEPSKRGKLAVSRGLAPVAYRARRQRGHRGEQRGTPHHGQYRHSAVTPRPAWRSTRQPHLSLALMAPVRPAGRRRATSTTTSPAAVAAAYTTVQAAIDASSDGDTILVCPGEYVGSFVVNEARPDHPRRRAMDGRPSSRLTTSTTAISSPSTTSAARASSGSRSWPRPTATLRPGRTRSSASTTRLTRASAPTTLVPSAPTPSATAATTSASAVDHSDGTVRRLEPDHRLPGRPASA